MRDLTHAQVRNGHAVGIVCDSTTGGQYEDDLFAELTPLLELGVHRLPMQRHVGLGDVKSAWQTYRLLGRLKPDILHGHGAKGGVYARLFGSMQRLSGRRIARLYSPHGGSLHYDENTWTGRFFFGLEALMGRFTDRILFVSDYERQTYVAKVGVPKCPSVLVYNGLAEPEFEPVPLADNAADFLYIGMMRALKGPDLFIEALARASASTGRPLSAVMVGDGDDLPLYRARVAELGLADRVAFFRPMPARRAFSMARCIVVPSRAEAMPYIVLEALAASKPMIATAVGGIPEIFGDQAFVLVTPDVESIAERMTEACTDPTSYSNKMPDSAALKRRFGVDVMASQVDDAYREALG